MQTGLFAFDTHNIGDDMQSLAVWRTSIASIGSSIAIGWPPLRSTMTSFVSSIRGS